MGAIAKNCARMEVFSLRSTKVTDESVAAIGNYCPKLRVLNLKNCPITSKSIELVAQGCKKLENLDITYDRIPGDSRIMSPDCLKLLANNCFHLKRIHLRFQNLSYNLCSHCYHYCYQHHRIDENCTHCYPIIKREVPIFAQKIGIQSNQLCLGGLVVRQN